MQIKGRYGKYGFYCLCAPENIEYARIVQIGWSMGCVDGSPTVKEYMVQPADFCVSDQAAAFHGIAHEMASSTGRPIREVLQEMLADVRTCMQLGGRVVCHQMERRA